MAVKQKSSPLQEWLQNQAVHITRIHFYLAAVFAVYIIFSDAWRLITPQVVLNRWTMAAVLMVFTTLFWFAAHNNVKNPAYYKAIIYGMIALDIAFATFAIYSQRGMASRGIVLYALPIASSAVLLSKRALLAVAAISISAYSLAAVRYFVVNPNEGYHAELYIEVSFYCAVLFILVAILWSLIHPKSTG